MAKMEQEIQQYKGLAMQEEIARRAFHAVASRIRHSTEQEAKTGAAEASKLAEQLLLLRNVRIDKYERQVAECGARTVCGEAFKFEGDNRVSVAVFGERAFKFQGDD